MGKKNRVIRFLVVSSSIVSILAVCIAYHIAMHSPLFLVRAVEVSSSVVHPPLSEDEIAQISGIALGKVGLYELDLSKIERRLLAQEWVKDVRIQKKFMHTVLITVRFREPKAIIQSARGKLAYLDEEGKTFGVVNLLTLEDLPLLSGFQNQPPERVRKALDLVDRWEKSPVAKVAQLSSVYWEPDRGFRILASYSLNRFLSRTMIDLGELENVNQSDKNFERIWRVISYLSNNAIASRLILDDLSGKKVVVKTDAGS